MYKKYIKLIISLKPELLTPYNNNFETYYEHIETVDGKKGTIDNNIYSPAKADKELDYLSKFLLQIKAA